MSPSVYVKLYPLIRPAPASKRVELRRCVPNVPECYPIRLLTGRKENVLPCWMELQLGVSSESRPMDENVPAAYNPE